MATTEFEPAVVLDATERMLAVLNKRADEYLEKRIREAMAPRGWFGKTRTRDEAITKMKDRGGSLFSEWSICKMYGQEQRGKLEGIARVARAAKRAGSKVMLDARDLTHLDLGD